MKYVKVENTQAQPYSLRQLRKDNPNTSFPADIPESLLAEYNVYPVTTEEKPVFDSYTQYLTENAPQEIEGVWTVTWTVNDFTQQEINDRVDGEVSSLTDRTNIDTALAYLVSDIWYVLNTGNVPGGADSNMTIQEARQAVKSRLKSHLQTLKGL